MSDVLIWIDLEMTGLDPRRHVILEIGSIVTGGDLRVIADGPDIVIHHSAESLASMDEWSRDQHQSSGLLEQVRTSHYSCEQAETETLEFLSRHCKEGASPLCGNSVWQDRRFLAEYMPRLEGFLTYRNIDVSSIKELAKRWYPDLPRFEKQKAHLALSDIRESIKELEYYRKNVFLGGALAHPPE